MRHKSTSSSQRIQSIPVDESAVRGLAQFRYALRRFLRFSEDAARRNGVTPQQHQLMLGIAGFTGRGSANVSELAEFLQEKPHSVAGLIERAVQNELVYRAQDEKDRRVTNVFLTERGAEILSRLNQLHLQEAERMQQLLMSRTTATNPSADPRSDAAKRP